MSNSIFPGYFDFILFVFKVLCFTLLGGLAIFGAWVLLVRGWFFIRGSRRPAGEHHTVVRPGVLYSFFWLLPVQMATDFFTRSPEYFRHQGLILFCGRQGSGKTVAMVEQTLLMQKEYPKAKCISNLAYRYQDTELSDWKQLIDYSNGIRGVIVQMDEVQNWFSSNQSKNFPPELLEVITQNRKNRRVILGTSQVFNRVSKPIREQTTEVRQCMTLFGALTLVFRREPVLDSAGDVVEWKKKGFYFFVHNKKIREAYDTYHVIESLSKSGFKDTITR